MPLEQIGNSLRFRFPFTASKLGKTGLTVKVNVRGPGGNILTGFTADATEVDATNLPGVYEYVLASGSVTAEGEYLAVAQTSDTTVDQRHVYAQWYVGRAGIEDLDAAISSRLAPTVGGRTLDVSAGGEAGVDWANVGSPTTTVGLSGTTVGAATALTNAPPDSAGVTSLLGRVGAFTGTGVNTVLGFFKALLSKTATLPTDVGGTFDPTTDSTEAIRDRGDSAWTTATGFSTHTAADVWAAGTRTLTAGTNIVLAKGSGVTGFNDLDAAGVRTAVGLASANLDTQIDGLPTAAEIVTALLAGTPTPRNVSSVTAPTVADCLMAAFVGAAGAESISGTTYIIKQPDGTGTFRSFSLDSSSSPTSRT